MEKTKLWNEDGLREYITSFLQEFPCQAVSEIVYTPTFEIFAQMLKRQFPEDYLDELTLNLIWKIKSDEAIALTICNLDNFGKNVPLQISVFPSAANYSLDELVSIIRDHEYVHAQDWTGGIPINQNRKVTRQNVDLLLPTTVKAIMEIRAYRHQLEIIPPSLYHQRVYLAAINRYNEYHLSLLDFRYSELLPTFDKEVIEDFLQALG